MILRYPIAEDVQELIARIRPEDRAEVRNIAHLTPDQAVPQSIAVSDACWAMRVEFGPLLCIFGVSPVGVTRQGVQVASIWMLGTDAIDRHRQAFWRECGPGLARCMDALPGVQVFSNLIETGNGRSRRWLTRLGAAFGRPTTLQDGLAVQPFTFTRKEPAPCAAP